MKYCLFKYKKLIFVLCFLFFLNDHSCQDSTGSNSFSIESQVYPNWNKDEYQPALKLRLILNENHVLRSNLSMVNQKSYREIFALTGPSDGVGSVENIYQFFSFSIGYEHLIQYNRISVYNGFEGIVGFGRDDVYGSRTDSIGFVADKNYSSKVPLQHLGVKVFSGIDFNITPNLYIGTEVGFLLLKTQRKIGTYQLLDESSTTSPVEITSIPSSSSTDLSFSGLGCIRVGWRFINK